jgi:hypothetical protein
MKTKAYLCAAIFAAMTSAGFAAHNSGHISAPPPRGVNPTASNDETRMERVVRYPFRAGYSVLRSPLIVGETFTGKRSFISNRGLFQTVDESAMSAPRTHTPQDRSPRSSR